MSKTFTQPWPQNVNNGVGKIAAADTTTTKDVLTAGANDSLVRSLMLTSKSSAVETIQIYISDGTNDYPLVRVSVPANAGFLASTPPADVLATAAWLTQNNAKGVIPLKTGWKLRAASLATVGGDVAVIAIADDY